MGSEMCIRDRPAPAGRAPSPRGGAGGSESPRRRASPLRVLPATAIEGHEPGQLSSRLFRADLLGAAKAIHAVHSGVATRKMFAPDYDGSNPYKPLPPKPGEVEFRASLPTDIVPTPDQIGRGDKGASPSRRALVEPWLKANGNILTGDLPADEPVIMRPKPEGARGRATADDVRAQLLHERFVNTKPDPAWTSTEADVLLYGRDLDRARGPPRAHAPDVAGRATSAFDADDDYLDNRAAPRARSHNSAWVADTADELLYSHDLDQRKAPLRAHAPDTAGKATAAVDADDDHLDNVGARAHRTKPNARWVRDTADDAIYGHDKDLDGAVRTPEPDMAGLTSAQIGEQHVRVHEGSTARKPIAWKHDIVDDWIYSADVDYQERIRLRPHDGRAGRSSAQIDWRFARETLMEARPAAAKSNQAWVLDVRAARTRRARVRWPEPRRAHTRRAHTRTTSARGPALAVCGPALAHTRTTLARGPIRSAGLPHENTASPRAGRARAQTSDELIFGGRDVNKQLPPREHDPTAAGKRSTAYGDEALRYDHVGDRVRSRFNAQWAHNTADNLIYGRDIDRQELQPRTHDRDAAGKSSLASDGDGAPLDHVGARAARERERTSAWRLEHAKTAIFGRERDGDTQPRTHDPDAAGKSTEQVELDAVRTGELGVGPVKVRNSAWVPDVSATPRAPARARVRGVAPPKPLLHQPTCAPPRCAARARVQTSAELALLRDVDRHRSPRKPSADVAGKSSAQLHFDERRLDPLGKVARKPNAAFLNDSVDTLIFGRDLDGQTSTRKLDASVAGKSSVRFGQEGARRALRADKPAKAKAVWVPETAGHLLFGGGDATRVQRDAATLRQHPRGAAGKASRASAVEDAGQQRSANLVWLYTQ